MSDPRPPQPGAENPDAEHPAGEHPAGQHPAGDARPTGQADAPRRADGRPAPQYGEYAPEGTLPPPAGGAGQGPQATGQAGGPSHQGQPQQGAPYQGQPYGGGAQPGAGGSAATAAPGAGAWAGGSWPQTLATYEKYEQAQAAVDLLSDEGFPVEAISIVGHDIRTVENVTGRLTKGKAALRGLGGGAWFGLLLGLLFTIFAPGGAWLGILLLAVGLGALWGALFGFVGHAATRGQRDFASVKALEAGRYEVLVRGELSAQAHQTLARGRTAA